MNHSFTKDFRLQNQVIVLFLYNELGRAWKVRVSMFGIRFLVNAPESQESDCLD